jgi:hypothetical protein
MRTPQETLADARIRVNALERQLRKARVLEARAEAELERADRIGIAPTERPPALVSVRREG